MMSPEKKFNDNANQTVWKRQAYLVIIPCFYFTFSKLLDCKTSVPGQTHPCVLKFYYLHLKEKESEPCTGYSIHPTQQIDIEELCVMIEIQNIFLSKNESKDIILEVPLAV